ncbi:MAG: HsdR family type I site-specific deoxyribonuclease [Verrucomicrobiota bacterium]
MEDPAEYHTPSYLEKTQSQLPALQLLVEMGWQYLPPEECVRLRGNRLGSAILEPVLTDFIRSHGRYSFKGREHVFTENAVAKAVQALNEFRPTGAIHQNEEAYYLLCLGTSQPQTIDGDTKSFTIAYIDWKHPQNNRYHCTAEYRVERVGQQTYHIPDIVLFVNGIPLVVIECKRSAYKDKRTDPIDVAVGQLHKYQQKDGIPQVFLYSQLLLALSRSQAQYGTSKTPRKFWSVWKEDGLDEAIRPLISRPLANDSPLLSGAFAQVAAAFLRLHRDGREICEQDRALYALCRPERLLKLIYQNIIFDNGEKKIARYQQFFAIEGILERIRSGTPTEPRPGGVIWHTQGSGKSLTMVMLAKALSLAPDILTPKVVLVTDRIDLDKQIYKTFQACGKETKRAKTGTHLVELLTDSKGHVVTTVINKFEAAAKNRAIKRATRDTFVLVDEGHRGHYKTRHAEMKLALKGACFIAFTGTPLAKSAKKNTFAKFGAFFRPAYTIAQATADKAVAPILYEARHVPQNVDQAAIDGWFEKLTHGLSKEQKADLKRKFSTEKQLNKTQQKVRMIAWDISQHYATGPYRELGLKAQLVTPDKANALLYKEFFDEFDLVNTQVLISGPNEEEGGDKKKAKKVSEKERAFWAEMMDRYGSEEGYNERLINAFKNGEEPEIIIVVDKLLTGFDAPCNAILYLARKLKDHTLLQAIARVNRLCDGKEHGLVLDYNGVIEDLDKAIDFYTQLADYDEADLAQTVTPIEKETAKLAQYHSDLWELFARLKGSADNEAFVISLRDEEQRHLFYDRFGLFSRTFSLALSSTAFLEETPEKTITRYKQDLKFFANLRAEAAQRYQEAVDFSEYEPKIQKLLDTHVGAGEIVQLCKPINLFDASQRQEVLEDQGKSPGAKADIIAAAALRVCEKEMDKDPAFYAKFSRLIQDSLDALHAGRVKAFEELSKLKDYTEKVVTHTDDGVPEELLGQDMARRYFGVVEEDISPYNAKGNAAVKIALEIQKRIGSHKIRDWRDNQDALNAMREEIDGIFFEVIEELGLEIPLDAQDALIDKCIEIAIANED